MNITSKAFCPRKSLRRTVLPVTTSVSAKSGASVPNSIVIVDSVSAMICPPRSAIFEVRPANSASSAHSTNSAVSVTSEQPRLPPRHGHAEMLIRQPRCDAPARRAVQESNLNQEWFVDLFQRIFFLGQGRSQRAQAHRSAVILLHDGQHEAAVDLVEAVRIHPKHGQSGIGRWPVNAARAAHRSEE